MDGAARSLGKFDFVDRKDDDAIIALQRGPDGPGPDFPRW